jgi:hypothetical protein
MAFFLIFLAAVMGISAVNGTVGTMFSQGKTDLFGNGTTNKGFLIWLGALLTIAAIARAIDLPQAGKAFIVLLILVFLLSNGGLLQQLLNDIQGIGRAGNSQGASK